MSAPDMGSMAVTNALNPPETSTSDVPNQIPMPDAPQTAPDPAVQAANAPPPAAPAKPSLWRGVLAGALQGLAAGSAVNTKGMGNGGAFAAGAGAGANQVLNKVPAQNAELDQAKATTAIHYANLAKIQKDLNLMPDSRREQHVDDAIDHSEALFKSGAMVPLSDVSKDPADAQKALMGLHAKNPWAVYSIAPVRDANGDAAYQVVQFGKAPIQEEVKLPGMGPDGKDLVIPAGTPGETVGKVYTQAFTKQMDEATKKAVETQKGGTRIDVQKLKNQGALDVQGLKNDGAAAKASSKPGDMSFATSPDGRQIAGSAAELQAAGIDPKNIVKLPGTEAQKVVVARQLIGPRKGLFDLVNKDIDDLSKQGKLGVVASRFGEFMAGKVGNEPDFQALRTHMGLLSTALMQAHVGARGSKDMLEHFKELANYSISNEPTLRKALQSEWEYVNEKAMLPAGNAVGGRSGPGQAAPTGSGKAVSLAAAKQLPAMKGKTDDEIKAAIQAQGHAVTN
jgi:hypothetical protein